MRLDARLKRRTNGRVKLPVNAPADLESRKLDPGIERLVEMAARQYGGQAFEVLQEVVFAAPEPLAAAWAGAAAAGMAFTQLLTLAGQADPSALRIARSLHELGPADLGAAESLTAALLEGTRPRPAGPDRSELHQVLRQFYSQEGEVPQVEQVLAAFGRNLDEFPDLARRLKYEDESSTGRSPYSHVLLCDYNRSREWWHPLVNSQHQGVFTDPASATPWKLHIAASTHDEVTELAVRLVPVVVERGLNIKLAGDRLLEAGDPLQSRKGAVVYLPRRASLAADVAAVLEALEGIELSGQVSGDVSVAPGVGMRMETIVDPGIDFPSFNKGLYCPADASLLAPDHVAACQQLRELLAQSKLPTFKIVEQAHDPYGQGMFASRVPAGLIDSARSARAMSTYILAVEAGVVAGAAGYAARAAWLACESRPEFIAAQAARTCPDNFDELDGQAREEFGRTLTYIAWQDAAEHAPWSKTWQMLAAADLASDPQADIAKLAPIWHALATAKEPGRWLELRAGGVPDELLVEARLTGLDASQLRRTDRSIDEVLLEVRSGQRPVVRPPRTGPAWSA